MINHQRPTESPTRILIVEDDALRARDLAGLVTSLGYEVSAVTDSADEAIVMVERCRPQLVLMGPNRSGHLTGVEAADQIRTRLATPVVYTVENREGHLHDPAKNRGPIAYLGLPAGLQELKTIIGKTLSMEKAERYLRKTTELLRAVNEAQTDFIAGRDPHHLFDGLLDHLISLTDSEYGFIDEIFYTGQGAPYRRTHAITNIAWNERTQQLYEELKTKGFTFFNNDTLTGATVLTGQPVIANDPEHDPRSGGLPAGHPALKAFLGLPLYARGKLIGTAGLANRPGGYDQEIADFLQPYLTTCANLIEAYRNDQERKTMEASLRESEERFRSVFENSLDGIILGAPDGKVFAANRAACEMFGITEKELCQLGREALIDLNDPLWSEMLEVRQRTGSFSGELSLKRRDGTVFPAGISTTVFKTPDGEERTTFIIRDISERKKAENALNEKTEALERSNRDLEQFAYIAAHDLREPLIGVGAYLKLLERCSREKLDGESRKFLTRALDTVVRMDFLIQSLLAYSRVASDKKSFQPTDCNSCLSQALSNLRTVVEESKAQVTSASLPTVIAIPSYVVQVFQNLIGNAIKFRGDDSLEIHVDVRSGDEEYEFSVTDNGIGIAHPHFDRIFKIFQRVDNSAAPGGTGIGLATCKTMIERHGGRIWVESEPGQGSIFRFTLPKK